jgi:lipoprotein-anchoring transpeptidase ErfK/SrfK
LEKQAVKSSNKYGSVVNSSGNIVKSNATAGVHSVPAGGRFVGAPMPYWMRLTSYGVGMHAGPIPNPGSPASHGCIRLPPEMAETLFSVVEVGTPVTIK